MTVNTTLISAIPISAIYEGALHTLCRVNVGSGPTPLRSGELITDSTGREHVLLGADPGSVVDDGQLRIATSMRDQPVKVSMFHRLRWLVLPTTTLSRPREVVTVRAMLNAWGNLTQNVLITNLAKPGEWQPSATQRTRPHGIYPAQVRTLDYAGRNGHYDVVTLLGTVHGCALNRRFLLTDYTAPGDPTNAPIAYTHQNGFGRWWMHCAPCGIAGTLCADRLQADIERDRHNQERHTSTAVNA